METTDFIKVLRDYTGTSKQDAEAILQLKDNFPFSQLLHTLSARTSKDHGLSNHQEELQLAAVYAADRGVLKNIMSPEFKVAAGLQATEDVQEQRSVKEAVVVDTIDFAQELIDDLERLHELKHNFELMFIDNKPEAPPEETIPSAEESSKLTGKAKKQRIIELARSVSTVPGDEQKEEQASKPKKRRKEDNDSILKEIATKEELSVEGDKQKEQIEIIDHFIRKQPSLTGNKDLPTGEVDHSSSIKTGDFGDLVSETLVEILLKQGKKDKAIEVLKKLIWKFPQKKAYFAAQIEDLRK